jgi:hypothetical protein
MKATLTVLALTLLVAAATRADDNRSTPTPIGPEKMTVADVLKGLSLDDSKLAYVDEPPGKLRELECEATLRDTKAKVRVRIEVVYTPELFSEKRTWDPKAVRAATARRVTITPVGADQ